MAEFNVNWHPVSGGHLCVYSLASNHGDADRPLVIFLHGSFRDSTSLGFWGSRLATKADVVLIDLPSHGRSSIALPASIPRFARIVGDAIHDLFPGRHALMVGESFGGLVAFQIAGRADPGPVLAVMAVDPPMTTSKLWNVEKSLRTFMAANPDDAIARSMSAEVFGVLDSGLEERIYYSLVGGLRLPAMIVTGSAPLMPIREVVGTVCMFDDVDRFVIEQLHPGKVQVRRLPGAHHMLLAADPASCQAVIEEMIGEHLSPSVPAGEPGDM